MLLNICWSLIKALVHNFTNPLTLFQIIPQHRGHKKRVHSTLIQNRIRNLFVSNILPNFYFFTAFSKSIFNLRFSKFFFVNDFILFHFFPKTVSYTEINTFSLEFFLN